MSVDEKKVFMYVSDLCLIFFLVLILISIPIKQLFHAFPKENFHMIKNSFVLKSRFNKEVIGTKGNGFSSTVLKRHSCGVVTS